MNSCMYCRVAGRRRLCSPALRLYGRGVNGINPGHYTASVPSPLYRARLLSLGRLNDAAHLKWFDLSPSFFSATSSLLKFVINGTSLSNFITPKLVSRKIARQPLEDDDKWTQDDCAQAVAAAFQDLYYRPYYYYYYDFQTTLTPSSFVDPIKSAKKKPRNPSVMANINSRTRSERMRNNSKSSAPLSNANKDRDFPSHHPHPIHRAHMRRGKLLITRPAKCIIKIAINYTFEIAPWQTFAPSLLSFAISSTFSVRAP